jgi:hypothetical protein
VLELDSFIVLLLHCLGLRLIFAVRAFQALKPTRRVSFTPGLLVMLLVLRWMSGVAWITMQATIDCAP